MLLLYYPTLLVGRYSTGVSECIIFLMVIFFVMYISVSSVPLVSSILDELGYIIKKIKKFLSFSFVL